MRVASAPDRRALNPGRYSGVLIAAALFTACGQSSVTQGVNLTVETSPRPARVGVVSMIVHLTGAKDVPETGAHLKMEADMSHPGMAPVVGDLTETGAGDYQATLNLGMAGDWVIVVRGTLADGRRMERELKLPGVRPD